MKSEDFVEEKQERETKHVSKIEKLWFNSFEQTKKPEGSIIRNVPALNHTIGKCLMQALCVDIRNIALFVLMVFCALDSQSVCLSMWILSCAQHKAASGIRRFTRWLKNSTIEALTWYKPLFLYAVGAWGNSPILLALDTTMLFDEFCAIRVSLIYLGRSVPVTWRVIRHRSSSVKWAEYKDLLEQAKELLPKNVQVILLADRGFVSRKLMLQLRNLGWSWRIRVMGKQTFICGGKTIRPKALPLKMGDALFFPGRVQFGKGLEGLSLSAGWAKGSKEAWYVLSDTPAGMEVFMDYACRFGIEEGFRDEKSGGFCLEESGIRDEKMLERMIVVIAVATIVAVSEGLFVIESGKREEVDSHWIRGLSYFQIGLRWIYRQMRQKEGEMIVHFELKAMKEPLPGAPSRKEARKRWQRKKPKALFYGNVSFNPLLG